MQCIFFHFLLAIPSRATAAVITLLFWKYQPDHRCFVVTSLTLALGGGWRCRFEGWVEVVEGLISVQFRPVPALLFIRRNNTLSYCSQCGESELKKHSTSESGLEWGCPVVCFSRSSQCWRRRVTPSSCSDQNNNVTQTKDGLRRLVFLKLVRCTWHCHLYHVCSGHVCNEFTANPSHDKTFHHLLSRL